VCPLVFLTLFFLFCRLLLLDSQPAPAYDLLVRFLTQKSMIDEELPQVRSSKPITPDQLPWLQLYPQGKKAYEESFAQSPYLDQNSESSLVATTASLSGESSHRHSSTMAMMDSPVPSSTNHHVGLLVSFLAGLVVALMAANFMNRRSERRRTGYSSVPDSSSA
jgi:hypothetical protein